ncbi:DDE-type integrase/transposase/recombinase [Leptolyngbyaceae cyanobacterium UHCC 1019]
MLNEKAFNEWCLNLNLSAPACHAIEQVRSSAPSRRVQSNRQNVAGSYPSRKMGMTIQFESHRTELARIYELERDGAVLEYYDQPPAIELVYPSKTGRTNRHSYTPDFFILRTDSAGWEECKTEEDLFKLNERSPNRYTKTGEGEWCCPPGRIYAARFGLTFQVWSNAQTSWVFQQNMIWLEDYFHATMNAVDSERISTISAMVQTQPGITLAALFQGIEHATDDDFYRLIATEQLYVNLHTDPLTDPQQVRVFANSSIALAYERVIQMPPPAVSCPIQRLPIPVGSTLLWDGEPWTIVNTGMTATGLLQTDGKFVELPNTTLADLIGMGTIQQDQVTIQSEAQAKVTDLLRHARPQDIIVANHRYEQLQPYLDSNSPAPPSRSIRRWCKQYHTAAEIYGSGYVGLLPQHQAKGNRAARLELSVMDFMGKFIADHYETPKNRRAARVYQAFIHACETHNPLLTPPSYRRFLLEIKRRSGYNQTQKREGHRAAVAKEPFYWQLELTTPQHGSRPFEITHIDHTQLDVELVSSLVTLTNCVLNTDSAIGRQNLGRPWATFMVDAYSRRLLAVYLSYEEPSYRSCMMVLRICVQRFQRFPQTIVVDNGSEFHSHYFEQLLAHFHCTKKYRPPAAARFGGVIERLFGTANTQFIHEVQGNTQINRKQRQVTKAVRPERHAIWTLGELYECLREWAYTVYDQCPHPSLGNSPQQTFASGLILGGNRLHLRIEYDEAFRILTLPSPERGQRTVQPGRGVKIHTIYYWCHEFRHPDIERSVVEVKYDPFDAGIAYALVRGQWMQCILLPISPRTI